MTERDDDVRVRVADRRRVRDEAAEPAGDPAGSAPSVEPSSPGGALDVEELAKERDDALEQAAQYLDDLRRLKAEFENYRKRVARDQGAIVERASAAVVERLLPVLDNFELALLAADRTKDYEAMVRGVEIVFGELRDLLRKEGIERIDAVGKPFDPELHEAVMRAEGDGDPIVVEEMRAGYTMGGRVVRPAMVKVGPRAPGDEKGSG